MDELFKSYYDEVDYNKKTLTVVEIQQMAFNELYGYAYGMFRNADRARSIAEIEAEASVDEYFSEVLDRHLVWFYTYRKQLESNPMAFFKRGVKYKVLKTLRKPINCNIEEYMGNRGLGESESVRRIDEKIDFERIIREFKKHLSPLYLLPDKQKQAFIFRYEHNYSDEEIVEILGIGIRTVQVYISIVLAQAKTIFK